MHTFVEETTADVIGAMVIFIMIGHVQFVIVPHLVYMTKVTYFDDVIFCNFLF